MPGGVSAAEADDRRAVAVRGPKTRRRTIAQDHFDVGHELAALREYYEVPASEAGIELEANAATGMEVNINRPLFRARSAIWSRTRWHAPRGGSVPLGAHELGGSLEVPWPTPAAASRPSIWHICSIVSTASIARARPTRAASDSVWRSSKASRRCMAAKLS